MTGRITLFLAVIAAVSVGFIAAPRKIDARPRGLHVTIGTATIGRPIPSGFVGLSLEYPAVLDYAGTNPRAINPVLEQLVDNIDPGQAPAIRIGGDSTDATWWPVRGMTRPAGIHYNLTKRWATVTAALSRSLGAQLLLGINMQAGSQVLAAREAQALVSRVGAPPIRALELGNEPELYGRFPWYQTNGHGVRTRPRDYGPADFTQEFARVAMAVPHVSLAGPATGAPDWWRVYLPQFVRGAPRLRLLTLHRYATHGCFVTPRSPQYHTIRNLLSVAGTQGLAASVAPWVRLGLPVRVDELGSVNCGGVRGVSDRFASALWALDTLFQLARVGVSGVNFHTFPGARYQPFAFRRVDRNWGASVKPVYYGMLMFAQAATPGSRLLSGSGPVRHGLDIWVLRAPDHRVRAVLINYGPTRHLVLHVRGVAGPATIERLRAPTVRARTEVMIGGRSFGARTTTGALSGPSQLATVGPDDGTYSVRLPGASAALITLARR